MHLTGDPREHPNRLAMKTAGHHLMPTVDNSAEPEGTDMSFKKFSSGHTPEPKTAANDAAKAAPVAAKPADGKTPAGAGPAAKT